MDINFLPEEDRTSRPIQNKKEHQLPKEEEKWSSPQKTGETKNRLTEKMGVKKYLPDFHAVNFFKKKNENLPRPLDTKNIKESRKELLNFISQQKMENGRTVPLVKKEEVKVKKNKIKLPDFSGLFSFFPKILKKIKMKKPKEKIIQANFIKEENKVALRPLGDAQGRPFSQVQDRQASSDAGVSADLADKQGEEEKKIEKKEEVSQPPSPVQEEEKKTESREEKKQREISLAKEQESSQAMETNLIKDEVILFFDWRKAWVSLSISVLLVVLALGVAYGLLSWQALEKEKQSQVFTQRFVEIDKEIKAVEQEVGPALVFKKKLSLVNSILSQHIYWTNFFKFLEENTLADVYYLGFSGDNKGKYSLSANAKDFSLIEAQVKKFLEDKRVTMASVSQGTVSTTSNKITGETAGINFELKLNVSPSIFTK